MNPLQQLFARKREDILNIFFTAGFPRTGDTITLLQALQESGVDIAEIGMPYSDPLADGPFIQQANQVALSQGMSISYLLDQLRQERNVITIPYVLMGYLNPVIQYGVDRFLTACAEAGVSGLILPDLPLHEFERDFRPRMQELNLCPIFLITPATSEARIRQMDALGDGFLYAVSSSATTGGQADLKEQSAYFNRLKAMKLRLPVLIGFGIRTGEDFSNACQFAQGAIIGTAFLRAIADASDPAAAAKSYLAGIR